VRHLSLLLLICLLAPVLPAQHRNATSDPQNEPSSISQPPEHASSKSEMESRRVTALNKERQEQLKRDADRLLQLATELKLSVDKSSEHTLSLDVMKKTEEIERLARSVRSKMKGQ